MDDRFFQDKPVTSKEAKWNLFHFQDHLLNWIAISAHYFSEKDYPNSFEALSILYQDTSGFFNSKESQKVDELFNQTLAASIKYNNYVADYNEARKRNKNYPYEPPMEIYTLLIKLRVALMKVLTDHQLLIPQIKKGEEGAGDI